MALTKRHWQLGEQVRHESTNLTEPSWVEAEEPSLGAVATFSGNFTGTHDFSVTDSWTLNCYTNGMDGLYNRGYPSILVTFSNPVELEIHMWGAGGGVGEYGDESGGGMGGASGYSGGTYTFQSGTNYYFRVGGGGMNGDWVDQNSNSSNSTLNGSNTGGGSTGNASWTAGQAGGFSGIFVGGQSHSHALIIAGGGGGGAGDNDNAGAGGGTNAQNGANGAYGGDGGTQTAGGPGGYSGVAGSAGGALYGGYSSYGGSGGGGYYGGGGGSSGSNGGCGGGGSGYVGGSGLTNTTTSTGSYYSVANTGSSHYYSPCGDSGNPNSTSYSGQGKGGLLKLIYNG